MTITQTWKRSEPDSVVGHRITLKITYSSFNQSEIDELEKKMPKGMIVANTDEVNYGKIQKETSSY